MAQSAFYKFNHFILGLAKGEHHLHAAGDVVKVYLTNNTPDADLHTNKADLTGLTEENGYAAADIQNDVSESSGTLSMTGVDYEWTFTGAVGPFRYAVLYNETHASDALIGYYDYGAEQSFGNGEKLKIDFGATIFTLTPT